MPVAVDVVLRRLGRLDGAFSEKPLVDRFWPVYMDALSLGKSRHEILGWHPFGDGGRESTQVVSTVLVRQRLTTLRISRWIVRDALLRILTLAHS